MKVFLSYAHSDGRQHVEKLNDALVKRTFTPWYDKRINPTRTFEVEIETAIEEAEAVIVCLTPAAVRKESFVRNEILYAQSLRRPIYAARFAQVIPPATIIGHTWLEFFKEDWNATLDRLCEWLHNPPSTSRTPVVVDDPFKPYLESALQSIVDGLRQRLITPEPLDLHVREESGAVDAPILPVAPPDPFAQAFSAVRLFDDELSRPVPEPTFTNFVQAAAYFKQRLLLLGEPGAGKTITLLDYARKAFYDRLENRNNPLPLFGLVPIWAAAEETPLVEWLATTNSLSLQVTKAEVEAGRVLLLLDGLDELGGERVQENIDEITGEKRILRFDPRIRFLNALQAINPANGIVLTSRINEYREIGRKVILNGALRLLPLAWQQIKSYLSDLPELSQLIETDRDLRDLAETPLLLSLLGFTYVHLSEEERTELAQLNNARDLRDRVFLDYVRHRYRHEAGKPGAAMPFGEDEFIAKLGQIAMDNVTYTFAEANVISPKYVPAIVGKGTSKLLELGRRLRILSLDGQNLRFIHFLLRDSLAFNTAMSLMQNLHISPLERGNSIRAIDNLADPRAESVLLAALADKNKVNRRRAALALGSIGGVDSVDPLIEILRSGKKKDRVKVAAALVKIGKPSVMPLIAMFRDSSKFVCLRAAFILCDIGKPAVEALSSALYDPIENVRINSAFALERINTPEALAAVEAWRIEQSKQ